MHVHSSLLIFQQKINQNSDIGKRLTYLPTFCVKQGHASHHLTFPQPVLGAIF